jgi:hypothetical protein
VKPSDESYSAEETEQRLRKVLRAAFDMRPTPLKDVPKKHGGSRSSVKRAAGTKRPHKS